MKQGWEIKKLGEVCKVGAGNSAPQKEELFFNGMYPFFRTSDVGKVKISTSLSEVSDYLNDNGIRKMTLYKKGTILIPKSGASTFLNHRVIMGVDGYVSSHLATLRTNANKLDTKFLFYFLVEIKTQDLIQDHKYPSLNLPVIENIEIPIPPISKQQRIVAILDDVFAGISKAKENTEKNLANARVIFNSYLNNVFSKPLTSWKKNYIKEVTIKIGSGATPTGGNKNYKTSGISLIRSLNVYDEGFTNKDLAFIDEDQAGKLANVTVEPDDVLINITGASIARCCIVPEEILPARVNQHVSIIRLKKELIYPRFLHYLLTAKTIKDKLLKIGENNGATRHALTKNLIEKFEIYYPETIIDQQRIVSKLDQLSAQTKKLEAIYQQKLADLEELKKSVLKKAYNGEI
jgi:type I restriction enzyme, S subunit